MNDELQSLREFCQVIRDPVCLQRVAACCSVVQCGAVWCSVLQCVALCVGARLNVELQSLHELFQSDT